MGMSRKARQVLWINRFPVGVLEHKYPQKSNLKKIKKYLTIKIKYSIINITKENKKHFKERGVELWQTRK